MSGEIHVMGTFELRRLAELATGRDFSGAFNEDVLEGAPEVLLLSLEDINDALGTDYAAGVISAWGYVPAKWTPEGLLTPGNGLPSVEDQLAERARQEAEHEAEA